MAHSLTDMAHSLLRFARDRKGGIAVMGAVLLFAAMGALAIGVDAATLFVEKRRAQGAVDLAALAAARDLPRAQAAAAATVADNRISEVEQLVLTTGNYVPDPSIAPELRFRPNVTPLNAARVEMRNRAPLYFARAFMKEDTAEISTRATAVMSAAAAFSIGSRLLSLNGGVLNAVLGRLLGGNVSLTAMDYNALAAFNVDLFRFSDALATKVSGNVANYHELASADASIRDVLDALIQVADASNQTAAKTALQLLGNTTNPANLNIPAGRLVDFGQHGAAAIGEGGSAFSLRASALSLLTTAAQIANGSRQVEVMTSLSLPGLLSLSVGITIGERPQSSPWIAVGERDVRVYTAQTRIRLIAEVGGTGLLSAARIRLPVYADIAAAEARLVTVACGPNPSQDAQVTLAVQPSVANIWIGEPTNPASWTNFGIAPNMNAAQIANVINLVTAQGAANVAIQNLQEEMVTFNLQDIATLTPKTVRTKNFTSSIVSSLVGGMSLNVKAGPLSLLTPLSILTGLITAPLQSVATILDGVLNSLLGVLGVSLGEADTWVHGIRCDGAVLVN